jgi:hypothetical protein
MNQPWYIKLGWWLCEKTGHLGVSRAWTFNGYYHRDCAWCGRIVSKAVKSEGK